MIIWNKKFAKHPDLFLERSLTLARKKIFIESNNKKYVIKISDVYSVVENKKYIIFVKNKKHIVLVIPKEAFSNNEEKKEFLEILSKFNDIK